MYLRLKLINKQYFVGCFIVLIFGLLQACSLFDAPIIEAPMTIEAPTTAGAVENQVKMSEQEILIPSTDLTQETEKLDVFDVVSGVEVEAEEVPSVDVGIVREIEPLLVEPLIEMGDVEVVVPDEEAQGEDMMAGVDAVSRDVSVQESEEIAALRAKIAQNKAALMTIESNNNSLEKAITVASSLSMALSEEERKYAETDPSTGRTVKALDKSRLDEMAAEVERLRKNAGVSE